MSPPQLVSIWVHCTQQTQHPCQRKHHQLNLIERHQHSVHIPILIRHIDRRPSKTTTVCDITLSCHTPVPEVNTLRCKHESRQAAHRQRPSLTCLAARRLPTSTPIGTPHRTLAWTPLPSAPAAIDAPAASAQDTSQRTQQQNQPPPAEAGPLQS
jgi:hypothetical protein